MVDSCCIDIDDTDNIDFSKLEVEQDTLFDKNISQNKDEVMKLFREDYIASLQDEYNPDPNLINYVNDLLEESDEQDLLIKVLKTL